MYILYNVMIFYVGIWYDTHHIIYSYGLRTVRWPAAATPWRFHFLIYYRVVGIYTFIYNNIILRWWQQQQQSDRRDQCAKRWRWPWDKPFGRIASAFTLGGARILPNRTSYKYIYTVLNSTAGTSVECIWRGWVEVIALSPVPQLICSYILYYI